MEIRYKTLVNIVVALCVLVLFLAFINLMYISQINEKIDNITINESKEFEILYDELLDCSNKSMEENFVKALEIYKVPCADIVLKQARLESNNFTASNAINNNNYLGLMNKDGKLAHYEHFTECIIAYKRNISNRYDGGDYYAFLKRIGYASDSLYIQKLKNI